MDESKERDAAFRRSVTNIARYHIRNLCTYIEAQQRMAKRRELTTTQFIEEFDFIKQRIKNDLPQIEQSLHALFECYRNGGLIPPFGRTEEEMAQAQPRAS
jgi:hypothetical protein